MNERRICINVDHLLEMFKDYAGMISIPRDAKITRFMMHPQERKFAFVLESDEWSGEQQMEEIRFNIRRVYGVS